MKINDTWNTRRLVDELFVPATQRIVLMIVGFHNLPENSDHKNLYDTKMKNY